MHPLAPETGHGTAASLCDHGGANGIFPDSGPFAPAAGALGSDFDDLRAAALCCADIPTQ